MIGSHAVTSDQFAALAAGGGDGATIEMLSAGQFSRRLLLLAAIREVAGSMSSVATRTVETAYALLADIQRTHPDSVRAVLTLPCAGLWAADCLRADSEQTYGYLSCLAATAAIMAGVPFEIEVPVWGGTVFLPGLGSLTLPAPDCEATRIRSAGDGDIVVGSIHLPLREDASAAGWRPVRQLRATAGGIELRALLVDTGPFRGPRGTQPAPPLSADDAARWQDLLDTAWELLIVRYPRQAASIAAWLRVFTPLTPPADGGGNSATAADAFGAVLLTPPRDAETLILALLHEAQHGKLSALHHLVPLHTGDPAARWYAPWRGDPRPLGALLQGAYAHLGVAGFWRSSPSPRAAEELVYWAQAVTVALGQLSSSAGLTPAGVRFTEGMAEAVASLGAERITGLPRSNATDRGIRDVMTWLTRIRALDGAAPVPVALTDWLTALCNDPSLR